MGLRRSGGTAILALWALACGSGIPLFNPSPPDLDAEPTQATPILVGSIHRDTLLCRDTGPDCRDWFRLRPGKPGQLRIGVAATDLEGAPAAVTVTLADLEGTPIAEAGSDDPDGAFVTQRVADPVAFLASVSAAPGSGEIRYELTPEIDEAPAPLQRTTWTVLEVEAPRGGPTSVLLDGGRGDDLHTGLRGRLIQGGVAIGRIEIVEVFDEGSRARVEGPLGGEITAETVAEIDVPSP